MIDDKTRDEIKGFYQKGQGSIQDYARIYRLTVDEVLEILDEQHLKSVHVGGDLIDPDEAGPGATLNYGEQYRVPFSTN